MLSSPKYKDKQPHRIFQQSSKHTFDFRMIAIYIYLKHDLEDWSIARLKMKLGGFSGFNLTAVVDIYFPITLDIH
jgi:hypothetical protein